MRKWTKEQEEYLKEISPGKFDQQITDLINKKFGTNYTKSAINTKKQKLGIRSTADWRTVWTDEVIQFMIENYEGRDNIELAELLNEKFNLNTNGDRVCNVKSNLIRRKGINLKTGINRGCYKKGQEPMNKGKTWNEYMSKEGQENSRRTCFKKGNIPMNKGKKWDDYLTKEQQEKARKTCFKKGQTPINHREVGSERINVDGNGKNKLFDQKYMWGHLHSRKYYLPN